MYRRGRYVSYFHTLDRHLFLLKPSAVATFAMKKTKTPKPSIDRKGKCEIESPTDESFIRLMKQSGVKALKTNPDRDHPKQEKPIADASIEFSDKDGFDFTANQLKLKEKYSSKNRARKQSPVKKKQKLAPGFVPDIEVDLHGFSRNKAQELVQTVIQNQRKEKFKNLLIITGRGLNSKGSEGILRDFVWDWLKSNNFNNKYKMRWAPPFLGGKGAIIVFFN